ncbi:MAG: glycosyltransferase family 4 protein [Candidatus Wallbacteria bacterium]|nr:glycosyltransferase family 4 protein [Candidatus Wallbacteria bacterium]
MNEAPTDACGLLVISFYFTPLAGGYTRRMHNLVRRLPGRGVLPHVLTVDERHYAELVCEPGLLDQLGVGVEIRRTPVWLHWPRRDSPLGSGSNARGQRGGFALRSLGRALIQPDRFVTWLPPALLELKRWPEAQKCCCILATGPPFSAHLLGLLASRLWGRPLILDFRDDWVDNPLFDSGRGLLSHILNPRLEAACVRRASAVLTATQPSLDRLRARYSDLPGDRFLLVPNGYCAEAFDRPGPSRSPGRDRLVVRHLGSLSTNRSPRGLFEALHLLRERDSRWGRRLRIVFNGSLESANEARVQEMGLTDQVEFGPFYPVDEVPRLLLEETDVCLAIQSNQEGGDTAIPGKVYEYLACGKPILCLADEGATPAFLRSLQAGKTAPIGSAVAIASALEELDRDYEDELRRAQGARERARVFEYANQAAVIAELVRRLGGEPRPL